jgi:hypothetical protein
VVKTVCEPIANKRRPANEYDAKFSIPYIVATSLIHGKFGLAELEESALRGPDHAGARRQGRLRSRSRFRVPAVLLGRSHRQLKDGRELAHREQINRGAADRPISNDDVVAKFMDNAMQAVSRARAEELRDALLRIEDFDRSRRAGRGARRTLAVSLSEGIPMNDMIRPAIDHEKEAMVLDAVQRFLDKEVRPVAHQLEHDDTWPADIVEKMTAMGLFGCIIAEEYGGLGLSTSTYAKIIENISVVWMSLSGIINSHLIMSAAVQRSGTPSRSAAICRASRAANARRPGADRARLRHRSAGDPHARGQRRRRLRDQRHQDLDQQRHPRLAFARAGQDRPQANRAIAA